MTHTRVLRHARNSLTSLSNNGMFRFAWEKALVHYPSGTVYSFIPKNACTSMRVSLAVGNGMIVNPATEWNWIHNNNNTFQASLSQLVTAPFTFVILRCPFSRLASAFLDKIVSRNIEFWTLHRAEKQDFSPADITFRQFVQLIAKRSNLWLDPHWRPQQDFLIYEDYDAWYALEHFEAAAADIRRRSGMDVIDTRSLAGHATGGGIADMGLVADMPAREIEALRASGTRFPQADLYDDALIAQVRELYRGDIGLYTSRIGAAGLMFQQTGSG